MLLGVTEGAVLNLAVALAGAPLDALVAVLVVCFVVFSASFVSALVAFAEALESSFASVSHVATPP